MPIGLSIVLFFIALVSGMIIGAVVMDLHNLDILTGYFAMERNWNSIASKKKAAEILINHRDLYKNYLKLLECKGE